MSAFRRYDILLPYRFNDGRPVPPDLIADTRLESEQAYRKRSFKLSANPFY